METSADVKRETLIRYKRAVLNAISNAEKVYKNQLQQLVGAPVDSAMDNAMDLTNSITARGPSAISINTVHAVKPNDLRLMSNNTIGRMSQSSNPVLLGPIHEKPTLKPIPLPLITDLPISSTSVAAAANVIKTKKSVDSKVVKKEGKTPTNQQAQLAADSNAQQFQRSLAVTNEMTRRKDVGMPIKPSPIPPNIINAIQTLHPEGAHSYPPMILPRIKGHWDYLIDEVQYIAIDYRQDLRWKLDQAKTVALLCADKVVQLQLKKQQNYVNEDVINTRRALSSKISSKITQYWNSVRDEIMDGIDSDGGIELLVSDVNSKDNVVSSSVSMSLERIQAFDKLIVDSIASINSILHNVTSTDTIKSGICYVNSNVGCGITLCGRGVAGKTVIASSIVQEWLGKDVSRLDILIISSHCNIAKWQKCLKSVLRNSIVKIWDKSCTICSDGSIIIVPSEQLASFIKRVYNNSSDDPTLTASSPVVFHGVVLDTRGINSSHMSSSFRSIDSSCNNWIAKFSSCISKAVHNRLIINSKGEISVEVHGLMLPFLLPQLYDQCVFDWNNYVAYCKTLNISDRIQDILQALTIDVSKYITQNEIKQYSEEVVYIELAPNQAFKYHKLLNYLIDMNHFDGNNAHCLMMGLILLNRICFHASLVNLEIGVPALLNETIENESKLDDDAMIVEDEGIYGQLASVNTLPTSDTGIISFSPIIFSNITSPLSSIFHNIPNDSSKLHKLLALLVQYKHKNIMVLVANNEQKMIVQRYMSSLDKSVIGHRLYYFGSTDGGAVDAMCMNDITFNSKLPYCLVLARPLLESSDISCQYCDVVINLSIEWFSKVDYQNKYPNTKNSIKVINVVVKNCWDDIFYKNNNSFIGMKGAEILQLHNSHSNNAVRNSKRFLGGIHSTNIDENSAFVAKVIKCYDVLESELNGNINFSIYYSLDHLVASCPSSSSKSPATKRGNTVVAAPSSGCGGYIISQDLKSCIKLKLIASRCCHDSSASAAADVGVACHILNVVCADTKAAKNEELRLSIFNEHINNIINNLQVTDLELFKRRFGFGLSEAEKQFWSMNIPSLDEISSTSLSSSTADTEVAGVVVNDLNVSVSSYASIIPEFKRFGDNIDEYMYVNPLQMSLYTELMYNPNWQSQSSKVEEELSVIYTSKAYKNAFGKSNGYVFDRSSVDGFEKSRKRLMVEYGNLLEDKRTRLESKVASRSARLSVYNPHSTAMVQITKIPLTRGSRECDMSSEPWSQREDNIIIAVQIINPFDLSFSICELLFNLYIPEALGRIRSKKQCKERYNQLLSQGKVDPSDPDIISCVNSLREILHIPALTGGPVKQPLNIKEETNEIVSTITTPRTNSNNILSSALLNDTFKLARVILQYNTDIANNKVTKILTKDNIIDNLTTSLPSLTPLQILLS